MIIRSNWILLLSKKSIDTKNMINIHTTLPSECIGIRKKSMCSWLVYKFCNQYNTCQDWSNERYRSYYNIDMCKLHCYHGKKKQKQGENKNANADYNVQCNHSHNSIIMLKPRHNYLVFWYKTYNTCMKHKQILQNKMIILNIMIICSRSLL